MTPLLLAAVLASAPEFHQNFETSSTPKVTVGNVNGSVTVRPSKGNTVKVDSTTTGKWIVNATGNKDSVEIEACCERCDHGDHHRKGDCDGEARINVEVPAGASLEVGVVNANVDVKGVTGDLEIDTVNGKVTSEGSAKGLEVSTVSGNVDLTPAALGRTELNSVSGDFRLKLPANSDAHVSLSSVSGRVRGKQATGKGTRTIEVSTVSGDVEVRE